MSGIRRNGCKLHERSRRSGRCHKEDSAKLRRNIVGLTIPDNAKPRRTTRRQRPTAVGTIGEGKKGWTVSRAVPIAPATASKHLDDIHPQQIRARESREGGFTSEKSTSTRVRACITGRDEAYNESIVRRKGLLDEGLFSWFAPIHTSIRGFGQADDRRDVVERAGRSVVR